MHISHRQAAMLVMGASAVLFKDNFSNAAAAPLAALAPASHRGVWATVDVENLMSVSSGKLNVPAQASAVWGEEYRRAQPDNATQFWTRPTGKALVAVCTFNHTTRSLQMPVGWWSTATLDASATHRASVSTTTTGTGSITAVDAGAGVSDSQAYNASTDYNCAAVWTSWGVLIYVKISNVWHLKWVKLSVFTQGYCGLSSLNAAGTIDNFKIVAVDESLFNAALDISNPSVGNLANMPDGDFLLYLDNITRPSAGNMNLFYRKKDTSNHWLQQVGAAGAFTLLEIVAGSNTSRISGSGVVSTDDIITIARSQSIAAWRNTTALGSAYTSAYNFLREIGLELSSLGTGGAIGRLLAWKARCLTETGLGSDVVVNGNFATDTVWSKGTGWTISGGTANQSGAGASSNLSQASILTIGNYYELTFTISNYSAGTLTPSLGSGNLVPVSANGTYTYRGVAVVTGNLVFIASSTFAGSIDNVSCKAIQFTDDALATALNGVLAA